MSLNLLLDVELHVWQRLTQWPRFKSITVGRLKILAALLSQRCTACREWSSMTAIPPDTGKGDWTLGHRLVERVALPLTLTSYPAPQLPQLPIDTVNYHTTMATWSYISNWISPPIILHVMDSVTCYSALNFKQCWYSHQTSMLCEWRRPGQSKWPLHLTCHNTCSS